MRESATAPIWGLLSGRDFDPDGWRRLEERAASNGLGRTEHARTMGRPTKLTAELSDQLCALLADGWFLDHACAEVGVSRKVVYEWLEAAEKADASDLHTEFRDACERARSAGERKYLDRIADIAEESSVQHGRGEGKSRDWKAHAWRLERMNPSRYKETRRTEITGANGGPVVMEKGSIFIPPEADD